MIRRCSRRYSMRRYRRSDRPDAASCARSCPSRASAIGVNARCQTARRCATIALRMGRCDHAAALRRAAAAAANSFSEAILAFARGDQYSGGMLSRCAQERTV